MTTKEKIQRAFELGVIEGKRQMLNKTSPSMFHYESVKAVSGIVKWNDMPYDWRQNKYMEILQNEMDRRIL